MNFEKFKFTCFWRKHFISPSIAPTTIYMLWDQSIFPYIWCSLGIRLNLFKFELIIYFILSFLVWLIECYLLRHSSQDLMSEKSVIGPTLLNLNDLPTTSCCPWLLGFSHYLYPLSCIMGFTLVDRSLVPWHASYFKYNVCGLSH